MTGFPQRGSVLKHDDSRSDVGIRFLERSGREVDPYRGRVLECGSLLGSGGADGYQSSTWGQHTTSVGNMSNVGSVSEWRIHQDRVEFPQEGSVTLQEVPLQQLASGIGSGFAVQFAGTLGGVLNQGDVAARITRPNRTV